MSSFNQNADLAKLLWDRLPGEYDLHRVSNYDQLLEGHEFASSALEHHATGRSEISIRAPTDSRYQYECLQTSEVTYMVRKSGIPKKTTETRVLRYSNGEWSIWRSGSDGIAVDRTAVLTLRHETAPPVGQDNKKVRGPSFRVVQEPKGAGKEERERIALRFFIEEEAGWEMQEQTKNGEKIMTQKDTYKIRQAKGIGTLAIAICGHGVVDDANSTDITRGTLSQRIPKLRSMTADASDTIAPPITGSSNPSIAPSISEPGTLTSPASGNKSGMDTRTVERMVRSGSGHALMVAANGDGSDIDRRKSRLAIQR